MLPRRLNLYAFLLLVGAFALAGCGTQPTVLPTQAAVAVLATAVPPEPTPAAETAPPDTAATVQKNTTVPDEAERPLLPPFSGPEAFNNEAGGLGAASAASALTIAAEALDAFANAAFTLNAALPAEPPAAAVLQAPVLPYNSEQAQNLAARFGFGGPLYTEVLPDAVQSPAGLPADAAAPPDLTPTFYAFDGPRTLNVSPAAAYYTDSSVPVDYQNPMPFDQAAPVAEAFLQARGLLDFPYALQSGWGQEVFVVRLINGRAASQPEISVGVGSSGQVAYATYRAIGSPLPLGDYPLIPAEAAWQQLQAGIDAQIVTTIASAAAGVLPVTEPAAGFQYWPRQHQSGLDVHLYAWPAVFTRADGAGAPRIQILSYTLQADDSTLTALAGQVGQNVHVWGSLDAAANTLAVAGWEPLAELNPLFKTGVVQRVDGEVRLQDAQSGETFLLPDAPADVPEGASVNVFAWAARDAGLAFPVLDWEGIDLQGGTGSSDTALAPAGVMGGETAVSPYTQITIDQVELAYYAQTINGEVDPALIWQPAWVFHATADNGDVLTFYVQAVDPSFRQS